MSSFTKTFHHRYPRLLGSFYETLFFIPCFRTIEVPISISGSKSMKTQYITLLLLIVLFGSMSSVSPVFAQSMQNESHNLFLDPIDDIAENEVIAKPSPTKEINQPTPKKTRRVFQEPDPTNISIYINTHLLSFGILSPTSPTIREVDVGLTGSTPSQILYLKKDSPFSMNTEAVIPDTSCDQGGCSEFIASDWNNTLTFGYGYSCTDEFCDSDFYHSSYRPFSNNLVSLYQAQIGIGNKRMLTIPVKINVPGTQENGAYSTSITVLSVQSL